MKTKTDWISIYAHTLILGTLAVIGAASENIISWWWLPAPIVLGMALFAAGSFAWAYLGYRWALHKAMRRFRVKR